MFKLLDQINTHVSTEFDDYRERVDIDLQIQFDPVYMAYAAMYNEAYKEFLLNGDESAFEERKTAIQAKWTDDTRLKFSEWESFEKLQEFGTFQVLAWASRMAGHGMHVARQTLITDYFNYDDDEDED